MLLLSGADPSIPNESGHLASELTSDKDIKMLLSREPSQAMNNKSSRYAVSAINQARQSLKAHVESHPNNDQSNASDIGLEKLAIADQSEIMSAQIHLSLPGDMVESPPQQSMSIQSVPIDELGAGSNNEQNDPQRPYNYIENDTDEAEEREGLKQAVLQAATDTAGFTQDLEGSSARRSLAEICQSTRYFAKNAPTMEVECKGICLSDLDKVNPKWFGSFQDYEGCRIFIISLGRIISVSA